MHRIFELLVRSRASFHSYSALTLRTRVRRTSCTDVMMTCELMRLHTRLHVLCLCHHAKPLDCMSLVSLSTCGVSFSVFWNGEKRSRLPPLCRACHGLSNSSESFSDSMEHGLLETRRIFLRGTFVTWKLFPYVAVFSFWLIFIIVFVFLMLSRALFYQKTPDAAPSAKRKCVADVVEHKAEVEDFPITGWTTEPSQCPRVTVATILGHLVNTGENVSLPPGTSHDALETIVHCPLDRGNALYFSGYVHDVHVCRVGSRVFVKSKCWATQKNL